MRNNNPKNSKSITFSSLDLVCFTNSYKYVRSTYEPFIYTWKIIFPYSSELVYNTGILWFVPNEILWQLFGMHLNMCQKDILFVVFGRPSATLMRNFLVRHGHGFSYNIVWTHDCEDPIFLKVQVFDFITKIFKMCQYNFSRNLALLNIRHTINDSFSGCSTSCVSHAFFKWRPISLFSSNMSIIVFESKF